MLSTFKKPTFSLSIFLVFFVACSSEQFTETKQGFIGNYKEIYYGTPSTVSEHTAVLQLFYNDRDYGKYDICTATLISDDVVMTAGHCVYSKNCGDDYLTCELENEPSRFTVRTGMSGKDPNKQTRQVIEIHAHPDYEDLYFEIDGLENMTINNDIALLRIASPFNDVQPIPALPETSEMALGEADVGKEVLYVGFGLTEEDDSGIRLQASNVIEFFCQDPDLCAIPIASDTSDRASPHTFTTYANPSMTCSGDSGGPALFERDGVSFVAGVTSTGDFDCLEWGANVNVSDYAAWIADILGDALFEGENCVAHKQCVSGICSHGLCQEPTSPDAGNDEPDAGNDGPDGSSDSKNSNGSGCSAIGVPTVSWLQIVGLFGILGYGLRRKKS